MDNGKLIYWNEAKEILVPMINKVAAHCLMQPKRLTDVNLTGEQVLRIMQANDQVAQFNDGVSALATSLIEELTREEDEDDDD